VNVAVSIVLIDESFAHDPVEAGERWYFGMDCPNESGKVGNTMKLMLGGPVVQTIKKRLGEVSVNMRYPLARFALFAYLNGSFAYDLTVAARSQLPDILASSVAIK